MTASSESGESTFWRMEAERAANPENRTDKEKTMDQFKTGDVIEHRLMPGFTMPVLETAECEVDSGRPEPHLAYKITDPDGNVDWLCAHDVQKPGQNLPWS